MSRCLCSSRALELFIRDLAGLNIRQSQRSTPLRRIQLPQRNISSRRPLRQLETITTGDDAGIGAGVEDGFVPFDFEKVKGRDGGVSVKEAKGDSEEVNKPDIGGGNERVKTDEAVVDQEWHAEIEIGGGWPRRTRDVGGDGELAGMEDGVEVESTEVEGGKDADVRTVDDVPLRSLHPPPSFTASKDSNEIPLAPPLAISATPNPTSSPVEPANSRSRLENRLARKQKRILEGTWAPQKATQTQEAAAEGQEVEDLASVLERIEGLEGPPVAVGGKNARKRARRAEEGARKDVLGVSGRVMDTSQDRREMKKAKRRERRETERSEKGRDDARVVEAGERVKEKGGRLKNAKSEGKESKTAPMDHAGKRERAQDTNTMHKKTQNDKKSSTTMPKPRHTSKSSTDETWKTQKAALATKFGTTGWSPSKKVSPDTMSGIRALHTSDPTAYTTATLAAHFEMSPEAIRRILRSKWQPSEQEAEDRRVRWEKRGVKKWGDMAEKGIRPPKRWREMGVRWERKSGGRSLRSAGLEGRGGRVGKREGEEETVGMLGGIEERIE